MSSKRKKIYFLIWMGIFAIGIVRKTLQNDTFYTIKIGELIFKNGIDMLDHFSFHVLPYTYPHWLYDCFIYLIYKFAGFPGIYISSIVLFIILLTIVFKINAKICESNSMGAFATLICALAISSFITARAQLVSFILFALEIYFIEMFLKNGKKRNLLGLLLISLVLCNIHVAVWPFYYILYLPYLVEYIVALICKKIKLKKENKFVKYLKSRIILELNPNIKYLFLTMILSLFTGLLTPIGDTPYTYLFKTMAGNSQKYIAEHQMMSWIDSPFPLIIASECLFLAFFSKAKLRDIFMICGLLLMNIYSIRHMAFLALIGTICFGRIFTMFFNNFDLKFINNASAFFSKKKVIICSFIVVIIFSGTMLYLGQKKDYIDKKSYPVEAVKYIKENIDIEKMRIFNEYNFGSYLILNEIPVFIDSRADLYTKQFSGLDYDIFDDYEITPNNYQEMFEFYKITHILTYKKYPLLMNRLKNDDNYKILYEDDDFIFFEKLGESTYFIKYNN